MNVAESAFSQYAFENHAGSASMVGGMLMTKLLANKRFVGGRAMDYDYIDKQIANLSNSRFDNLVVPIGFYVERDHTEQKHKRDPSENQYINEEVFENLFGIIIREPQKHNKSINNKTKSKNRNHKQSSKKARK